MPSPAATSSIADGRAQVPLDTNGVGLGANPSQARMYF